LPGNAGQADDADGKVEAEAALQEAIKALEATLAEMKLQAAQSELKHRGELASLETKLAVADTLAQQRQAEIERLHELCKASAQQVPGIRMALRQWLAKRLVA
jgi:chromosome segregation ATPase